MSQLINILLAKDKYNGCDIDNYYDKPKEGAFHETKNINMYRNNLMCDNGCRMW